MIKKLKEQSYWYLVYASYALYIISFLGISFVAPEYHSLLIEIIKIYVCVLLIYNFNPWGKKECTTLDKNLAFSAAWFLVLTTVLGQAAILYTHNFIDTVKTKV
tara:strand:- start:3 stop:314 length:312 start_codon:yes stop_codon:yes gene_type:complete